MARSQIVYKFYKYIIKGRGERKRDREREREREREKERERERMCVLKNIRFSNKAANIFRN